MSETRPQEFEGRLSEGKDWREIVAWVGDLPPMPQVAAKAINMVEDPTTTAEDLNKILSKDTALAARVLKIANSAMFSRQREITTLNQAVMIIGFKALKGIIVAATLRQVNKGTSKTDKLIWENSMCTAMCATLLARKMKKSYVDEIFLLGLLHSLGQIVFLSQEDTASDYKKILEMVKDEQIPYAEAEQKLFGFAHPLIGALVAKKWNFSADTCQVILHYCDAIDGKKAETPLDEKTALVKLADKISHAAEIGSPPDYPKSSDEIKALMAYLEIETEDADAFLEEIITQSKEQFENEGSIYS